MKPIFVTLSLAAGAALAITGCATHVDPDPAPSEPATTTATTDSTTAAAASPASARPAAVPADFVETPSGYMHPSCIVDVAADEEVTADGAILDARGMRRDVPSCRYHRYGHQGEVMHATPPVAPELGENDRRTTSPFPTVGHKWLADFGQPIAAISWTSATFRVPTAPLSNGSQVVYLFNGLEPMDGLEIIQPVLGWNQPGSPNRWVAASWDVKCDNAACNFPTTFRSAVVNVNAGDTLSGYMYPSGTGRFFIGMNRNGSYLTGLTASSGKTFQFLFGGVLEVWNLSSCQQLPSTGYEFFTSESIYQNGAPFTPHWQNFMATGLTPNCNVQPFSATTTGGMSWLYQ